MRWLPARCVRSGAPQTAVHWYGSRSCCRPSGGRCTSHCCRPPPVCSASSSNTQLEAGVSACRAQRCCQRMPASGRRVLFLAPQPRPHCFCRRCPQSLCLAAVVSRRAGSPNLMICRDDLLCISVHGLFISKLLAHAAAPSSASPSCIQQRLPSAAVAGLTQAAATVLRSRTCRGRTCARTDTPRQTSAEST